MTGSFVKSRRTIAPSRAHAYRAATLRRSRGEPLQAPSRIATAHVRKLVGWGLTVNSIAAAAGVSHQTVKDLLDGRPGPILIRTHWQVMRVSYKPVPEQDGHEVLAVGAVRRLQALRRIGYNLHLLDELLGARDLAYAIGGFTCVKYARWLLIRDVYDRCSMVAGPSVRARNHGVRKGWPSPLDWESVDIDDPEAQPLSDRNVGSATQRRAALAQGLLGSGLSVCEVAVRLGVTVRSVERWKNVVIEDE